MQVREAGGDIVLLAGDDLASRISDALGGTELDLVIDGEAGGNVGALASSLRFGGPVVAYSAFSGALPAIGILGLILREMRLSGWWLVDWIRNTPRGEIEAVYNELDSLTEAGVISSAVEAQHGLDQYREAFEHATRSGRRGKILFDPTR